MGRYAPEADSVDISALTTAIGEQTEAIGEQTNTLQVAGSVASSSPFANMVVKAGADTKKNDMVGLSDKGQVYPFSPYHDFAGNNSGTDFETTAVSVPQWGDNSLSSCGQDRAVRLPDGTMFVSNKSGSDIRFHQWDQHGNDLHYSVVTGIHTERNYTQSILTDDGYIVTLYWSDSDELSCFVHNAATMERVQDDVILGSVGDFYSGDETHNQHAVALAGGKFAFLTRGDNVSPTKVRSAIWTASTLAVVQAVKDISTIRPESLTGYGLTNGDMLVTWTDISNNLYAARYDQTLTRVGSEHNLGSSAANHENPHCFFKDMYAEFSTGEVLMWRHLTTGYGFVIFNAASTTATHVTNTDLGFSSTQEIGQPLLWDDDTVVIPFANNGSNVLVWFDNTGAAVRSVYPTTNANHASFDGGGIGGGLNATYTIPYTLKGPGQNEVTVLGLYEGNGYFYYNVINLDTKENIVGNTTGSAPETSRRPFFIDTALVLGRNSFDDVITPHGLKCLGVAQAAADGGQEVLVLTEGAHSINQVGQAVASFDNQAATPKGTKGVIYGQLAMLEGVS